MYRIYANGEILHNPLMADRGRIVVNPVLQEKLNTHGSLQFEIAPSNPLFELIQPRNTLIRVVSDTNANNKPWFGRVVSVERGWKNMKTVYCEGVLGHLCDSLTRPFVFKGSPAKLLDVMLGTYRGSTTRGPDLYLGNVSVTDPNNTIIRSSDEPMSIWSAIEGNLFDSSLGGYIIPRYDAENDRHYVDYLSLDENDQYARVSSQVVEFGRNLLDFTEYASTQDVITVLVPYGAEVGSADPPSPGQDEIEAWDANRLTIESVNGGRRWIENADGIQMWGRIVGTYTWDDVTVPANLLTKAQTYLAQQMWQSVTLEVAAVDLAFVNADIEQIQVGEYVRCKSKPHDLNVLLLCTEKTTYLTELEKSDIVLGAGMKTITDLQKGEK